MIDPGLQATDPMLAATVPAPAVLRPEGWRRWTFSWYSTPIAFILDYLSICLGAIVALLLHTLFGGSPVPHARLTTFAFSFEYTVAFILFGRIHSLYSYKHNLLQIRDTAGILRVSSFCFLLLAVVSLFSRMVIPWSLLTLSWALITFFVLMEKHALRRMFARWKARHPYDRQVLIVGVGSEARRIFSFLLNSPDLQLRPVGFFEETPAEPDPESSTADERVVYSHGYQFRDHAKVYSGRFDDQLLRSLNIAEIFIANPNLSSQRLAEIGAVAARRSTPLSFVASVLPPVFGSQVNFQVMDGLFVNSFSNSFEISLGYELVKRALDVTISLLMLLASLPAWLIAAIWVKSTSEGPVFFKQERIGRSGKPFEMYKFRSMYITASKYERSPVKGADPRITSAGRFLRKTSLDELPQLLNVLLGQMSLVGPRPEMPYVVSEYTPEQRRRLSVAQGLTGMWQLSADRKFAIHESLEYDLYYIENRGIFIDLAILLHTAAFAMKGI